MQILDNNQFFFIAFAHFLAVVSPGPDFILINRQSFLYGRSIAIFTSSLRAACRMDFLDSDVTKWAARWHGFATADSAAAISFE